MLASLQQAARTGEEGVMPERASRRAVVSYSEDGRAAKASTYHSDFAAPIVSYTFTKDELANMTDYLTDEVRPPARLEAWMFLDCAQVRDVTRACCDMAQDLDMMEDDEEEEDAQAACAADLQQHCAQLQSLLAAGFPSWTAAHFQAFLLAAAKYVPPRLHCCQCMHACTHALAHAYACGVRAGTVGMTPPRSRRTCRAWRRAW
ncbi:hypothetical protein EON68_02835 [archaeon]|nr:MAG: hypothetical protein EON68_02835 [archaeon]